MIFSRKSTTFMMADHHRDGVDESENKSKRSVGINNIQQNTWRKKIKAVFVAVLMLSTVLPPSAAAAQSAPIDNNTVLDSQNNTTTSSALLIDSCAEVTTSSMVTLDGKKPVIDSCTDLNIPVPHHKVSGHFEGTDKKFNFYFPLKIQWKGHFFQRVYPLEDENATDGTISFGADNGAYTVKTNNNGGYKLDAAAAQLSREVAAKYYDTSEHIYGYIYGGSGGSFQTIGAIENADGVWDGAVPFIPGVPTSIPNNFFIRAFARFVLEDKAPKIAEAMSPGGSGDPYGALNDTERKVLQEVTNLGAPLRAWDDYQYMLRLDNPPEYLLGFGNVLKAMDPTYVDDFWSKPGYLGTEQSELGDLFRNAKVDFKATILEVNRDGQNKPISLLLDSAPLNMKKTSFDYTLYGAEGTTKVGTLSGSLNSETNLFTIGSANSDSVLSAINKGAKLQIDNKWFLAMLSYHRHQVPKRAGFYAWDQFRAADGTPIYPQRPLEIGKMISLNVSGGGTHTGAIKGKVIVVANLLDCDAYSWDGDWYRARVRESLGEAYNDNFRLWYNDNADHIEFGPRTHRIVQFDGIVEQALRDLSAWVEKGVQPAQSTQYEVVDSQIKVPKNVEERHGIQPVVDLTVGDSNRVEVKSGQTLTFKAKIQVPLNAGKIVHTEWDFLGTGDFKEVAFGEPNETVVVTQTFTYNTPGTYFPALRVTSQREGDTTTPFAHVENIGRVRVIVSSNSSSSSSGGSGSSTATPAVPATPATPATPAIPKKVRISLVSGAASNDGESLKLSIKPYVQNGRTMVGVRDIATLLHVSSKDIVWDASSKSIMIKTANKEIKLILGQKYAVVDGQKVIIDVAPEVKNGKTVLPIVHVAKLLGLRVEFNPVTKEVTFVAE